MPVVSQPMISRSSSAVRSTGTAIWKGRAGAGDRDGARRHLDRRLRGSGDGRVDGVGWALVAHGFRFRLFYGVSIVSRPRPRTATAAGEDSATKMAF